MHSAGTRKSDCGAIGKTTRRVFVCVFVGFYLFSYSISCLRLSLLFTFLTSPTYSSCERSRCLAYSVLHKQTTHRQGYALVREQSLHTQRHATDAILICHSKEMRIVQLNQEDNLIRRWRTELPIDLGLGRSPMDVASYWEIMNRSALATHQSMGLFICSVFTSSGVALVLADEAGGSSSRTNRKFRFNLPLIHGMCCVTIGHHTAHTRTHVTHQLCIRSLLASDENGELKLGSFHLPTNSFRVMVEKNHRFGSVCCVLHATQYTHTHRQRHWFRRKRLTVIFRCAHSAPFPTREEEKIKKEDALHYYCLCFARMIA